MRESEFSFLKVIWVASWHCDDSQQIPFFWNNSDTQEVVQHVGQKTLSLQSTCLVQILVLKLNSYITFSKLLNLSGTRFLFCKMENNNSTCGLVNIIWYSSSYEVSWYPGPVEAPQIIVASWVTGTNDANKEDVCNICVPPTSVGWRCVLESLKLSVVNGRSGVVAEVLQVSLVTC